MPATPLRHTWNRALLLKIEPAACAMGLLRNPEREKNMGLSITFLTT